MANITLKGLLSEADDFKAKSKESGKMVHFKSKDSYQAALKAGTHEDPKAKKGDVSKAGKSNDMFGGDYAKDRGSETPKTNISNVSVQPDSQEVKTISKFTNTREKFIADFINKHKLDASALSKFIEKGSLRDRMDVGTAMVGNPGNKYEKDLIKKFGAKEVTPKSDMGVDKVVYNTRTNTVGIVRMADERGETKTDADGNVNTDELEPYNPMQYPHQKDAKVAPSTKKEIDTKGLWKPFSKTEQPTQKREGDTKVNKKVIDTALSLDITPTKYATSKYEEMIGQAAVEALTDANFHAEARELIAKLEGKPDWAKDPNKVAPEYGTPEYKKWRKNSVYSSKYYNGDADGNNAGKLGRTASEASGWDGVTAVDAIAAHARKMGSTKLADTLQSVFDNKPYMKNESTKLKSMMKK